MNIKLTSPAQVALLREGDIIKRFPSNCDNVPQDTFDELRPKHIDSFVIKNINPTNAMFSLVTEDIEKRAFVASAGISRLFIRSGDFLTEKVWWVNAK